MRLLLNVSVLRGARTGIGHYTLALAQALSCRPEIESVYFDGYATRKHIAEIGSSGQHRKIDLIKRFVPGAYRLRRHLMQRRFSAICRKTKPDLYHEPTLWPLRSKTVSVVTVHDLTHVHYPKTQPRNRLAEIERHCAVGLKKAGCVVVDSAFISREVIEHYGLAPENVVVAPLGVSAHFKPRSRQVVSPFCKRIGLQAGKYILSVGTLEPRKNLSFTLKAYRLLPEALQKEYPLILVGASGWNRSQFSADLASGLSGGRVRTLGYLDDRSLALLTSGGRMLVYPSLYEGFGLPVVEAMASGLPVIASDRASLPEVAGNAALFVAPDDLAAYRRQMIRLMEDQKAWETLRQRGFARAARFTWQRCAEKTLLAYRKALDGR